MQIEVKRIRKLTKSTVGEFYINGNLECYTVEDTVREIPGQPASTWKIPHVTAIPVGTYNVVVTMSNRFKKLLPLLENVPGFEGIRIHTGNTAEDTEGCLIVGNTALVDRVAGSVVAFNKIFPKIKNALAKGEKVTITIS